MFKGDEVREKILIIMIIIILSIILLGCTPKVTKIPSQTLQTQETSFEEQTHAACLQSCKTCEQSCDDQYYEKTNRCGQIKDKNVKQECMEKNMYITALQNNNKELCKKISNSLDMTRCMMYVQTDLAVKQENVLVCDELHTGVKEDTTLQSDPLSLIEECKTGYYMTMAQTKNDPSICEKITFNDQRMICKSQLD